MSNEPTLREVWSFYRGYVRPHRRTLAAAAVCLLCAVLMEVARPWPLKIIFDYVLIPTGKAPLLRHLDPTVLLAGSCAAILVFALAFGLLEYAHTILAARVGQKIVYRIREQLFHHVQRLSLGFHNRSRSGDLLSRLIRDVTQLREFLADSAVQLASESVFLAGAVAVMIWLDWPLALAALALFPALAYSIARYSGQIRGLTRKRLKKEGAVASLFSETLAGIQEVQLFGSDEAGRFDDENRRSYKAEMKSFRAKSKLLRIVELLTAAGTCVVLWWGVARVLDGRLSAGGLLVFLAYLRSLYKPVRRIASLSAQASRSLASAERVMQILRTEPEIQDAPDAVPAPKLRGAIEFRDVSFSYDGDRAVLRGFQLRVEAGTKVAVVGASGAGKSTLMSLLPRLYDPNAGAVLIDGVDVRRFTLASLRDQITVVPQDPVLFGTTVYENIRMADPSKDDSKVRRAAWLAYADEFVAKLPLSYATVLGERGANLSGGQRQRIAIARALLREAPIVILDEPMTGLDLFSETLVLRALRNLLSDKTAFIIAHRLATILECDQVIVLDQGAIIETGAPQDLIRSDGPFRKLAELEFGADTVNRMARPVGGWSRGA